MNIEENIGRKGVEVNIYQPVTLIKPENLYLNNYIIISEYAYINAGLGTYVGNHIHISTHSSISGGGWCILEDFSGLSAGVRLITGSALFDGGGLANPTLPEKYQSVKKSYVIVKRHATLATNVIVHPGVIIEEGTVVASGSVVTKNTEPWSIYMGVPAKKVKSRRKEDIFRLEKDLYAEQNLIPTDYSELINKVINKNS
ncbi:MAG: acyltransferase [Candidatus Cyclobacteriaceae bacterium M2_1C_046]